MDKIIGLIPAAGKGSRLGLPFPKELYPVLTKGNTFAPVALGAMEQVSSVTSEVVVVVTPKKHKLMAYYGGGGRFGMSAIRYAIQESGNDLADAVRAAYPLISGKRVALVMPDTIIFPEIALAELDQHMTDDDDMIMGLFKVSDPSKFGMVASLGGQAISLYDKPEKTELEYAWGCLLWHPTFTEVCYETKWEFSQLLNTRINYGKTKVVIFDKPEHHFYDLGTVDGIKEYWHDELF